MKTLMKAAILVPILLNGCLLCEFNRLHAQQKVLSKQLAIRHDNDVFRLNRVTDRYYSFGLFMDYSSVVNSQHFLKRVSERIGFSSSDKLVFDNLVYLKGYTPDYEGNNTPGNHRPFAGILNWEPSVYVSNSKRVWRFGLLLGVRGEMSGAEWVQKKFHQLIGDSVFVGWKYQLPNKLLFGINSSFIKPFSIGRRVEVFSKSDLSLGNYQIQLQENVGFRVGLFNRVDKSSFFRNFLDLDRRGRNEYFLVAYLFGRTIVTDASLTERWNEKDYTIPFEKRGIQAGYRIAFHFQVERFGFQASHTRNSTESNFSGKHSFGSLLVSYSFH